MFTDEQLLELRLIGRRVYADEQSAKHGQVRRKYKLYCDKLSIGFYFFIVGYGDWFTCDLNRTVWVRHDEWEDKVPNHLTRYPYLEKTTFFDLGHTDSMSGDDIVKKFYDPSNEFLGIATVPQSKYDEFKNFMRDVRAIQKLNKGKISTLAEALLKEESEQILKALGLA